MTLILKFLTHHVSSLFLEYEYRPQYDSFKFDIEANYKFTGNKNTDGNTEILKS